MPQNTRYLLSACLFAIVAFLFIQFYWIKTYYASTLVNFERDINLAFEDGVKKEFLLRCDTIQQAIENNLLDSSKFIISSKFHPTEKVQVYTIRSTKDRKDKFSASFSKLQLNQPLAKGDVSLKRKIAAAFAQNIRQEDLENHFIYYRTQDLGRYIEEKTNHYQFDTASLRKTFNYYLNSRGIKSNYTFILKYKDSTLNNDPKLFNRFKQPIITKSLPTYILEKNSYVRASFTSPFGYVISRTWLLIASSMVLMVIVCYLVWFLTKTLLSAQKVAIIKEDFISNITHEFKTPIATVAVAAEALEDASTIQNSEKRNRYLSHIKNEAQRLNLLVDQVMSLSLQNQTAYIPHKETIVVSEVINQLVKLHQIKADKPLLVNTNVPERVTVEADKSQFYHALNNIMDNAIKYSADEVNLQVNAYDKNGFLVIEIIDKGIGMEKSELKLIFDKFYRVKNQYHSIKGHGLGLTFVKQIIEQHHGWYKIDSEINNGTKVTLAWPQ